MPIAPRPRTVIHSVRTTTAAARYIYEVVSRGVSVILIRFIVVHLISAREVVVREPIALAPLSQHAIEVRIAPSVVTYLRHVLPPTRCFWQGLKGVVLCVGKRPLSAFIVIWSRCKAVQVVNPRWRPC